jgi:hypothetical protein
MRNGIVCLLGLLLLLPAYLCQAQDKSASSVIRAAFAKLDAAVYAKQAYETKQVKQIFHGKEGKKNFEKAVVDTEAERKPLADAVAAAVVPIEHTLKIEVQ